MVTRCASACAALVAGLCSAATATAADWSAAGGDLFVAPHEEAAKASQASVGGATGPWPFAAEVSAAAAGQGLDPKLLQALVIVESADRPEAVSPAGAAGLTQLMPATARELGVTDVFDPAQNLSGGADFLGRQLRRFRDVRLALAAFQAGPDRVARLGGIPAIPATRVYVEDVVDCFLALTAGQQVRSARDCRRSEDTR
jgi:soluble lytic murein transglycosylase-like protein